MKNKDIEKLYQLGRTEKSPQSLDHIIISQAKISCNPEKSDRINLKKWIYSFSTAAVLVLSFSVIINLQNENSKVQSDISIPTMELSPPAAIERNKQKKEVNKNEHKVEKPAAPKKSESAKVSGYIKEDKAPERTEYDEEISTSENLPDSGTANSTIIYEEAPLAIPQDIPENRKIETDSYSKSDSIQANTPKETGTLEPEMEKLSKSIENKQTQPDSETNSADDTAHNPLGRQKSNIDTYSASKDKKDITESKVSANEESLNISLISDSQLEEIRELIRLGKEKDARELIRKLKELYPDYDFSEYDKQIKEMKKNH